MAETLRELVVALSLDSSNFSRNMRTINQQIKEAESTFRLAGAGVQNYEKTIFCFIRSYTFTSGFSALERNYPGCRAHQSF